VHPIRLHLDTSDYAAMYRAAPGSEAAQIRDFLKSTAELGTIQIGLSYHVVFELLQKATPQYREDRLARARLLVELCGKNAFPYPTDLGQGYRFSTEGFWIPRIDLHDFEIENVVARYTDAVARQLNLSRQERRAFCKRRNFVKWARADERRLKEFPWSAPFGPKFALSGEFRRYVLGEMSRTEANNRLRCYLTDPVHIYNTWFDHYGLDNPIVDRQDQTASKLTLLLSELKAMLADQADLLAQIRSELNATGDYALSPPARDQLRALDREVKTFGSELKSPEELTKNAPRWQELFGEKSGLLAAQILYAFHNDGRDIKHSDGIDLIHAMYLPHSDLWRGDRAFSTLLINNRVDFCSRIVSSLAELPGRIEAAIAA
jgi:hypothetical protein